MEFSLILLLRQNMNLCRLHKHTHEALTLNEIFLSQLFFLLDILIRIYPLSDTTIQQPPLTWFKL